MKKSSTGNNNTKVFVNEEEDQAPYQRETTLIARNAHAIPETENKCEFCHKVVKDHCKFDKDEASRLNAMIQHVFSTDCKEFKNKEFESTR